MKYLSFSEDALNCKTANEVFDFLLANLKSSKVFWSHFVNWKKVFRNVERIEPELNKLNCLIGTSDFDNEFRCLLKRSPSVAKVLPALVAWDRASKEEFKSLVKFKRKVPLESDIIFTKEEITDEEIEEYLTFVTKTGLKHLVVREKIKSFVDYMIGVEVGLDKNARKKSIRLAMANMVEAFIKGLCGQNGNRYIKGAGADEIKREFYCDVPVDKPSRRYDFVVGNGKNLFIIKTDFYGEGRSQLKAMAKECRDLHDMLNGQYNFIWVTDGYGWKTATGPLRKTFDHNDYVFSLAMLEQGIFDFLIASKSSTYY